MALDYAIATRLLPPVIAAAPAELLSALPDMVKGMDKCAAAERLCRWTKVREACGWKYVNLIAYVKCGRKRNADCRAAAYAGEVFADWAAIK